MNIIKLTTLHLVVAAILNISVNSLNILVVKVSGTRSHNNFYEGIIDALVDKNHTVTFISMYPLREQRNLNQIIIESTSIDVIYGNVFELSNWKLWINYFQSVPKMCVKDLGEPRVQEAMQDKFDVAILSFFATDCFLSVIYKQKIPFIYANTISMVPPYTGKMGDLFFESVTPNIMLTYTHPLPFVGRLSGTITDLLSTYSSYFITNTMDRLCHERNLCPSDMPPMTELEKTASIAIINSVRMLESPVKTALPSIIYAGGIHIKPTKPLSKELQQWMEDSGEDGVIFFSLGSAAKPSEMKRENLQIFLNVFGSLKQRVLWKFDLDKLEGLPSNIKLDNWFPQQDILAHTKTRLFITHGGLLSTQEATYYGIPVIGMPIFVDQINNIAQVVADGWGLKLDWNQLTEESLRNAIHTAINDQKLRIISEKRSQIMKDQPISPAETVTYWVEYVVKHNGAEHFKSPFINMPWYKTYNVDVWIFTIFFLLLIIVAVLKGFKFLIIIILRRLVFSRKSKAD